MRLITLVSVLVLSVFAITVPAYAGARANNGNGAAITSDINPSATGQAVTFTVTNCDACELNIGGVSYPLSGGQAVVTFAEPGGYQVFVDSFRRGRLILETWMWQVVE